MLSADAHIALNPNSTYRALVAEKARVSVWRMLCRPFIVSLVIGTAVPIMAVQRITRGLLASSMMSFLFAVAIQMAVGALVIASSRHRRITTARAMDLWFAGHLPYSLWLLTAAAVFAALPAASLDLLIVLAALPAVWTTVIVAAFCRQVLGTSRAGARWRAAAHFVAIWAIALELVALSAGGWFQITGSVTRMFS